jgi:hypothetical protein
MNSLLEKIAFTVPRMGRLVPEYYRPVLKGCLTYIPGLYNLSKVVCPSPDSARYYYSIWLRHLVMTAKNGLDTAPAAVAELGPGGFLGVGLAALMSGADRYYALDAVPYIQQNRNLEVFHELVTLFNKREHIPNQEEFPEAKPTLDSYDFPDQILTEQRLEKAMDPARLRSIEECLSHSELLDGPNTPIVYIAPWNDAGAVGENSIDMIISQAVLEHVANPSQVYGACYSWLKKGGLMSHQIDYKSHGITRSWNGHWTYSNFLWRLIKGRRPYLLNREPHSVHLDLIRRWGFKVIYNLPIKGHSDISRGELAGTYKTMSDDDMVTTGAFVQAVKV